MYEHQRILDMPVAYSNRLCCQSTVVRDRAWLVVALWNHTCVC
jgi:hypothetical protein